jgi:ABC-type polysaccharide/polyol phosphate transport system ATPase subunit
MQSNIAIKVSNLSKTYKLYGSRYHVLGELVHPLRKKYHTRFHALKNISFQLGGGEVLGIIGRNGSGKSTLLKILASVVTPTSGTFEIEGRFSALLELGGGFNKDMTGVENVYFLGGIQGYSKVEMKERLKEILDFAEIGEYAWQPVKTYSSGMYVRLAFSVAIHIDPEILIVDEALAVGDLRFQQKCFRRIREFKEAGKTIVICTHNLGAVNQFCTRAMWLHSGEIRLEGTPKEVTDAYIAFMNSADQLQKGLQEKDFSGVSELSGIFSRLSEKYPDAQWVDPRKFDSSGKGQLQILVAGMMDALTGKPVGTVKKGTRVRIVVLLQAVSEIKNSGFELLLNDRHGALVFRINSFHFRQSVQVGKEPVMLAVEFEFPAIANGRYTLSMVALCRENQETKAMHQVYDAFILNVSEQDVRYSQGGMVVLENADFSVEQSSAV